MLKYLRRLRSQGVLGMNARNASYTLRWNPRRHYPLVDDKLQTKRLCREAQIPIPELYTTALHHFQLPHLLRDLEERESFVLKPARGAMGNGILVVRGRQGRHFVRAGGRRVTRDDLRYHAASIISGLYAIAGQTDAALVEERLVPHPTLDAISFEGVPDVRVIVFQGIPVMAMLRLPTRRSGGRANLHQGAVGAGVDLVSGRITHAVQDNGPVTRHPDTGHPLVGVTVPDIDSVIEIAVRAADRTDLGYVGADVVVDGTIGPVILELNARPGLAIQLANMAGLRPRLRAIENVVRPGMTLAERLALGREVALAAPRREAV